jgi:signal transduction histidine kinase
MSIMKILVLEDSEAEFRLIQEKCAAINCEKNLYRALGTLDYQHALERENWSVVIVDYFHSQLTGLESLAIARKQQDEVIFILHSHDLGGELVADLIHAGVDDVVSKSNPSRLALVVERLCTKSVDANRAKRMQHLANEAVAAKEQMIAIVSHDIKNPLSAIRLEAQMILRLTERNGPSPFGEEVKNLTNRILKTSDRLKLLICDLLDRNKTESGLSNLEKSRVDVTKLLRELIESFRPLLNEKELAVNLKVQDGEIFVDRNKMFQVLSNLLSNAIKFSPRQSMIDLNCRLNGDEDVYFDVTDRGPGLSPQHLAKVFDKYWTGNLSSGTGLGLFICKTVVQAHGGVLKVENTEGKGACFSFTIPKLAGITIESNPRQIVVIDDDEDLRDVISWHLVKEGFSVETFRNPLEALKFIQLPGNVPKLILADYHMDGMLGGEFLLLKKQIHAIKDCPVVMISACPDDVTSTIVRTLYNEVFPKPLDLEGLAGSISKYFTVGRPGEQIQMDLPQ